ncbi:hypothetical protein PAEPH01_0816 [Pancytospora epiphaga]|nr:hypothetical protein PAEPH01_0816 [Pancytospora epiphaga]
MNRLYQEVSNELVKAFEEYIDGTITLSELHKVSLRENLVYEHRSWQSTSSLLRSRIFTYVKQLYDEISEMDKNLRTLEMLCKGERRIFDRDALISHSLLLGRNRMPPTGLAGSAWYVGPYPTLMMVNVLSTEEEAREDLAHSSDENMIEIG